MPWKTSTLVWWKLLRPFTLTASVIPVLIGSGLAFSKGFFHPLLFWGFLIASMLIQSATNMFNEYFDYKRGLDTKEMVGIAGTIVRDGVRPRTVLTLAWLFMVIAIGLGVYICAITSWWIALVGTICLCISYLYSGGPKPLAYTPFGELTASIAMGPVIVLLSFYIQAHEVTAQATAISVPIGLLIGAILLGNNIRDMDLDRIGGRRTIAILLGRKNGCKLFASVFIAAYVILLALIATGLITPLAIFVLITIPSSIYVVKLYYRSTEPAKLHAAVKGTSSVLFRFGGLMFLAMIASHIA